MAVQELPGSIRNGMRAWFASQAMTSHARTSDLLPLPPIGPALSQKILDSWHNFFTHAATCLHQNRVMLLVLVKPLKLFPEWPSFFQTQREEPRNGIHQRTTLGLNRGQGGATEYRTLSDQPQAAARASLQVVPTSTLSMAAWQALLEAHGLRVVDGPNAVGSYALAAAPPATQVTAEQL